MLLGATSSHASVILKISTSNPSSFEAQDIPVKSYLPKGIRPEDVINADGLEIGYDVKRDQCYVHKSLTLGAMASVAFNIEIEDIWLVDTEEIAVLGNRTDALVSDLRESQYSEVAVEIQENIRRKIDDILDRQEDELVFKVGPTRHIAAYDTNKEAVAAVKGSMGDLERFASVAAGEKELGQGFDQTRAAKRLQAQRVKNQILNFGDPDNQASCLVEESLEVERESIILESPETVLMKIQFENPSMTKRQIVPLRYSLAKEVYASDVIDSEGLKVGFDFGKGLYYVYNDSVTLEPGETKEFNVTLNNKWAVDKSRLYGLKVYLETLTRVAEDTPGLETAQEFSRQTLNSIYVLLRQADPTELTENYVVSYRNNQVEVEDLRQSVGRMEDFLVEKKVAPEMEVLEQELLCLDSKTMEKGSKDSLGLSGILNTRRIRLLAGTIFRGKSLSTADTWKIIHYIIIFLGVLSGVFYFVNIRQQKSTMFDSLTGAFARGYALDRFREELKIAKGGDNKCSLLVMDIDKFKGINDTHGHAVGDSVLREFVIAIRKGVRATDLVGRFGGDEFVIILPTGEKDKALKIAESIARIVEGTAIRVNPQLILSVTASIGVATFPDDSTTAEDLFDKADQALYQVKKRGGNGAEPFGGNV